MKTENTETLPSRYSSTTTRPVHAVREPLSLIQWCQQDTPCSKSLNGSHSTQSILER